ncbi:hypothetical protein [Burkholderia sp. LMG 21824]|uniref:hypothetical protein n=1 Tax=Burkholderia sp. LMG 21824 TaxID=3158172 RepID=UPI003C2BAE38
MLGKQYHYTFDIPEHLGAVPASPYRKSINAALCGLVAQGSKVLGKFSLQLRRDTDRITTAGKTVRVLATPVTLAADGVMTIGAVVLSSIIEVMLVPVAGVALGP